MFISLALLDPKALEYILWYPFEYRDESKWPIDPFSLALDTCGGFCWTFSSDLSQLKVKNVPVEQVVYSILTHGLL